MASTKWVIGQERRPCMVMIGDKEEKAMFHTFITRATYDVRDAILMGQSGGQIGFSYPVAVIELEDGSVHEVMATSIRFLDSKEGFSQYAWEGVE